MLTVIYITVISCVSTIDVVAGTQSRRLMNEFNHVTDVTAYPNYNKVANGNHVNVFTYVCRIVSKYYCINIHEFYVPLTRVSNSACTFQCTV